MAWRALNVADLLAVASNMRACDRREIVATRFDDDMAAFAVDLLAGDPLGGIMVADDGVAVAAIGASEMWPGNWSVWMFATDRWPEVAYAATRFAATRLRPALIGLGARRGECRSIRDHAIAHRWLSRLGFEPEAVYPGYGRDGETFIGFVFHASDFEGENDMCGLMKPKPRATAGKRPAPVAVEAPVTETAEQELRRLRTLNGRRSTILTPTSGTLGAAPTAHKGLLGS